MLKKILEDVNKHPTMMDIEDEIRVMNSLMAVNKETIMEKKEILFEILDRLDVSHHQAIFSVNKTTLHYFIEFGDWLRSLAYTGTDRQYLLSIAETMEAQFE